MIAVEKTKINTKTIVLIFLSSFFLVNIIVVYVYWENHHQKISNSYEISQQEQQIFSIAKNKAIEAELTLTK